MHSTAETMTAYLPSERLPAGVKGVRTVRGFDQFDPRLQQPKSTHEGQPRELTVIHDHSARYCMSTTSGVYVSLDLSCRSSKTIEPSRPRKSLQFRAWASCWQFANKSSGLIVNCPIKAAPRIKRVF